MPPRCRVCNRPVASWLYNINTLCWVASCHGQSVSFPDEAARTPDAVFEPTPAPYSIAYSIIGSAGNLPVVTIPLNTPPTILIEGPPNYAGCLSCHQLVSVTGVWYPDGKGESVVDVAPHMCCGEERPAMRVVPCQPRKGIRDVLASASDSFGDRFYASLDRIELTWCMKAAGFTAPYTMPQQTP